jgi:hypothetical protein
MNYRLSTVHPEESYTSDKEEIIDLTMKDPVSALIFELGVTNGGSGGMTAHQLACLTKLELMDGSTTLFSLDGYETDALDYYIHGVQRSNWNMDLNGNTAQRFFAMNFGRWIWDPLYALVPGNFDNLQVKASLDVDAGGDTPSAVKLTCWAALFDEKTITPVGFLAAKEIKDYAMGANEHEYVDLPTDHPYRRIFIKCLTAGTEPNQLISNIKLSSDQDKKVIMNHRVNDWMRTVGFQTPPYTEHRYAQAKTTSTENYCTPTSRVGGVAQKWATAVGAGEIAFYDGDGGKYKLIAETATSNINVLIHGWLPHGVMDFPFGDQKDPDDWYKMDDIESLKLDLTGASGASSSNTCQVCIEQARMYA